MHDKDATPIEAIDFETLQPEVKQSKQSTRWQNKKPILWLAFILLLLCTLIVFSLLPKYVADQRNHEETENLQAFEAPPLAELPEAVEEVFVEESAQDPVVTLSPEELSALKLEAEELLLQLIEKQELLETKAVKKWAEQEFKIALELGSSGDEHFRKQQYNNAIASYKDAVMILNDLENKIQPTLEEHLEKGELALTQAEKETAVLHFGLAKDIDTDNSQATNGLKRAETIEELYRLLEQGGKFEAANQFSDAENIYKKATVLDPLSPEAKNALNRVSGRLATNEFNRLINQGYAALKKRQYGDARAAFTSAQKLFPNSKKPGQGIAAIEQEIRSEKLSALSIEAQHFEDGQDWSNAAKSYQQMLTLSSNSSDALQGLERSTKREKLLNALDQHINSSLRLSSEQVASNAKQLLQEVSSTTSPGSKIIQRAAKLKELIQLANQPISITLQSDNLTDIVIFKVGKFGKFEQRKIELKTGKYTIVGSRSGFRDVRKVLTVTSDMSSKSVMVRCDEAI